LPCKVGLRIVYSSYCRTPGAHFFAPPPKEEASANTANEARKQQWAFFFKLEKLESFKDLVTLLTGSTRMHSFDWRRGGRRRGLNAAG
jgi:hypothetical protein